MKITAKAGSLVTVDFEDDIIITFSKPGFTFMGMRSTWLLSKLPYFKQIKLDWHGMAVTDHYSNSDDCHIIVGPKISKSKKKELVEMIEIFLEKNK